MALYRVKCRKLSLAAGLMAPLPTLWYEEIKDIEFDASSDEHALTTGNRLAFLQLRDTMGLVEVPSLIEVGTGRELLTQAMEPTEKGFVLCEHPVPKENIVDPK
jgi:hypothetical protein